MMGRQVGFRLTVDDLQVLDEWLQNHNGVVLIQPQPTSALVISHTLGPIRSAWPVGTFSQHFFARSEDVGAVQTHYVEPQDNWLVSQACSPVVEFHLMEIPGTSGAVAHGRFYFRTTFIDPTTTTGANHPADFVRWADSLLRWARRTWTKVDGVYYSPSAVSLV